MSFLQSVIDRGISRDTIPIIAFLNKSILRDELVAVRKEVKLRLAIAMLSACLLLFFREPIAYRVTSAILAVAVTLLISKLGFGMQ